VAVTTATYTSYMLAQAPRIGFLVDFPSRSALEDRGELRWANITQATLYLGGQQHYS